MLEMHLHFVSTAASSRILVSQTEIFKGGCAVLGLARPARAR